MANLLSIGTAVPSGRLTQERAKQQAKNYNSESQQADRVLERLYQRTAIASRATIFSDFYPLTKEEIVRTDESIQPSTEERMLRYSAEITPLAAAAAAIALEQAQIPAAVIGNLVTVSCTGFFAPGLDTELIEKLSLRRDVSRTNIGFMGCHGALNGLRVASSLAKSSGSSTLLVAAEICSLHFQYGNKKDDLMANALFADGAAAVVISDTWQPQRQTNHMPGTVQHYDGHHWHYRFAASGSYLVPHSREAMSWQIGDHGFAMTLSATVPALIGAHLRPWLSEWLAGQGLTIETVGAWAVHPGGPKILDAVEKALGLDKNALASSREILRDFGNMSSPTILFVLDKMAKDETRQPRDGAEAAPTVALAFGPGLTIEAALLTPTV